MGKYKSLLPVYLKGLVAGKYTLAQAAGACGYSVVRMCQLKKQYELFGLSILEHKGRGRIPANKTPASLKNKIMAIYAKPEYSGINFKYFCECLNNYENIKISYSNLLNIMKEYGIKSPEAHKIKKAKPAHRPRVPVRLLDEFIPSGLGETMPQVVQDIVYRYMYAYAKEISA